MFRSRVESRLKEFEFLWQIKPLGEPWSTKDTILVKGTVTRDMLGRNMNPDTKWWAYLEQTDSEVNVTDFKVVSVPWVAGSFANAIRAVAKYWRVRNLVSCESSRVHSAHPVYTVWRVPEKA